MSTEIDELKAQLAKLRAEIEALKNPPPPPPRHFDNPYDHNIRFAMPASAVDSMTSVVGDKLMRDIVGDHLGKPTSLPAATGGPTPIHSDRGWVSPAPLAPVAPLKRQV
jgi:hypothetical protein